MAANETVTSYSETQAKADLRQLVAEYRALSDSLIEYRDAVDPRTGPAPLDSLYRLRETGDLIVEHVEALSLWTV